MMNEEVRRIMTTNPVTVKPTNSISEVSEILMKNRTHHVPVIENGKVIGLITTYDLWKKIENSKEVSKLTVRDVMNDKFIKITPIDKVGTAAELFLDNRFHALPVVNLRGELKGVVTSYDVLKYSYKREYKESIVNPAIFNDVNMTPH